MVRIGTFRKVLPEQFPEVAWIARLTSPLNKFIDEITRALNKRLTISDNFDGEVRTVTADGSWPIRLAWGRATKPAILMVGGVARLDGKENALSSAYSVDWKFNSKGEIQIDGIPGLPVSTTDKYRITLVILTG